jgi:uncharacterized membrane protein
MVESPINVLAVLLSVLGALFAFERHPAGKRLFSVVPLLVFAYFVPTALSNTGVIPTESDLYTFIKRTLLPASLILLVLSVDIPSILGLGRKAISLFLLATAGIVLGGPVSYALLGGFLPPELGDQAWKGLAALSGSWIGGGANYVAIGESVGATDSTMGMMVVVDVAVANIWMAILLYFAGRSEAMDEDIGADRSLVVELRQKVEAFQEEVTRPLSLPDLLLICTIAFGGTALAKGLAPHLPTIGSIVGEFTWVVILVTAFGITASFSPLRKLEGAGASKIGSLFLYLLVASIGAHAEFAKVLDAPYLIAVGAVWMLIHAAIILVARWKLKAPIFLAAVGSQANVGGAASAPIVAAAFHPALAPVGILLAVGGYVLGTYAGLLSAYLLELVYLWRFAV